MNRRPRYVPPGGCLVEVTSRTLQGRYLLRPSEEVSALLVGCLARAQRLFPVRIHAFAFLSNHFHLLLSVPDAKTLARFMCHLKGNLSLEIGHLHDWPNTLWPRRYQAIEVSEEEEAQVGRLRYILAQGCKEGLVARPRDWPGLHSIDALTLGETLRGYWVDRTAMGQARNGEVDPRLFLQPETLHLDPLPCWEHLEEVVWRRQCAEIVQEIEEETADEHRRRGTQPLGPKKILAIPPHTRPENLKHSPAPRVHAFRKEVRQRITEAYRLFVLEYREAAARLRLGDVSVRFPEGCFPPPLPFVQYGGGREPP